MFLFSANKNSSQLIKIDDHSILICLIITAVMVAVTVIFADSYPFNEPQLYEITHLARKSPYIRSAQEKERKETASVKTSVFIREKDQKKKTPPASLKVTVPKKELEKGAAPTVATKSARISSTKAFPAPVSEPGVRLRTIRGGRHEQYASVVFEFSDPVGFEMPQIQGPEIQLRLKDTMTRLRSYRKYKSFDSWVRLRKAGDDLDVRIGVPENFIKLSAFKMEFPDRIVINLYDRKGTALIKRRSMDVRPPDKRSQRKPRKKISPKTVREKPSALSKPFAFAPESRSLLRTIRGGRHAQYASIVFQFTEKIDFEKPRIQGDEIRIRLKNTMTRLLPYRKYKSFDSWVRLQEAGGDLDVCIGLPGDFLKLSVFLMQTPHRLVVNLYDRIRMA